MELPLDFTEPATLREQIAAAVHRRKRGKKKPAELFEEQLRSRQLPEFAREWRFAKAIGRQWRFDFAFLVPYFVAIEIEGLVVRRIGGELVVGGRHASITGMREDMRKYNTAARMGWSVLRFEQGLIKSGEAIDETIRMLASKGWRRE